MRLTYIFTIILMLAFFYFFASCIKEEAPDDRNDVINYIKIGDPLPEFTVDNGEGNKLTNKDFIGKKSYLVFFTTTCRDCQRELPRMDALWQQIKGRDDCQVIAVSRKQGKGITDEFWSDNGFTMPKYLDPDRAVYDLFANSIVPRIYLIDRSGVVRWMGVEDITDISNEELLMQILNLP